MKVADLSVEDFRALVREVVDEALAELLDPDAGLELNETFVAQVRESLERGEPTRPAAEVFAELGR